MFAFSPSSKTAVQDLNARKHLYRCGNVTAPFVDETIFLHGINIIPLQNASTMCVSISGNSVLFHWLIQLSFYEHSTILSVIPLYKGFKSGSVRSLTLFLFSRHCWTILFPQTFYTTLESVYWFLYKILLGFLWKLTASQMCWVYWWAN